MSNTQPNFYKIDCEQEVVVQGKTTTFVTITRNDLDPTLTYKKDLVVILYPEANTFNTYARIESTFLDYVPSHISGGVTIPDTLVFTYSTSAMTSSDIPSFNKIETGLVIKNWYDIVFPTLYPTDNVLPLSQAPFVVTECTTGSFSIAAIGGGALEIPTQTTFTFDIGKYDHLDGDNWEINGGDTNVQMRTLNNPTSAPYWKPALYLPNPFDGTMTGVHGTGLYSRHKAFWARASYDVNNTVTKGLTFKIDYDGVNNSHLKINFLVCLVPKLYAKNLTFYINSLVSQNQIRPPYGLKSRDTSVVGVKQSMDYKEIQFFGYTEDYVKPSRDNTPISYPLSTPVYDDRSSYGLLKTNPKISGNVKLTVDVNGSLWLNSFNANDELSDSTYKKFSISSNSTYQKDLYSFFKNGQTPTSIVYDTYQVDNQYLNTKRSYSEQYDNFYNYGVENLKSKFYDENFSFLAPLWLRKDVPDYFVIFRVNEPMNVNSYEDRTKEIKFDSYFSGARIIKTFDMRDRSKLGTYLRNISSDPRFKERPLEVSWESDTPTYWNGVAYQNGSLTAKGEFLHDYYHKDGSIKDFEELITGGFERTGIISSNLINLEFLFNDDEAPMYGINRYFGFYVNENQLAEFEIEPSVLGKIGNQTPMPKAGIDGEPYSTRSFVQNNPDGIQIPVHYYHSPAYVNNDSIVPNYQGFVLGKFPLPSMVDDPLRFFYVKDRNDIFKRVNKLTEVDYGTPGSSEYVRATQLQLFDNQEDMSSYAGVSEIVSQFPAKLLDSGKSQLRIHLLDQHHDGVLVDNEELLLEVTRYNDGEINNHYVIQVTDVTPNDVTVEYFINGMTDFTTSNRTQPAVGAIVSIPVNDITKFSPGEQIYIVGGGYYLIDDVDIPGSLIGAINLGGGKNALPGTVILDNSVIANSLTGEAKYTINNISNELSIDNYLTINLVDILSGYFIGNAWRIEADYPSVQKFLLFGTTNNIDAIYRPQFQQFTWRMIANPTGLQPGDAWDYPVLDPNGSDYMSAFSNKGTPEQVAIAMAKCINSFEGCVIQAYAEGNILYLLSSLLYEDGNDIQFTRKLKPTSYFANLGFYVEGNVNNGTVIEQKVYAPFSSIDLKDEIAEQIDYPHDVGFYLKIRRLGINSYNVFGRKNADVSTYALATTTGTAFVHTQASNIFKELGIPISFDMIDVPVGETVEIAYNLSTTSIIKQNFIGGVKRKRNRAKISLDNGKKYYTDHHVTRFGITVAGLDVVIVDTSLLYLGAPISGPGIPDGTIIIDINADRVTISELATIDARDVRLVIGDLNILNDDVLYQQWYQAQKGLYSRMKGWDVQGKLVYSLPYMDEPVYDDNENLNGFIGITDNSVIQLEDTVQEFYISNDERIVAYKVFRPTLGIFSIYPIKEFDFDFIFSDYSYTPTLEVLPYFFKEKATEGNPIELPMYENFSIKQYDGTGNDLTTQYSLSVEVYNKKSTSWVAIENLTVTPSANGRIIFNTFYPFYEYDVNEMPIYRPTPVLEKNYSQFKGSGKRNFDKRYIRIFNEVTQKTEIVYPDKIRIKYFSDRYSTTSIDTRIITNTGPMTFNVGLNLAYTPGQSIIIKANFLNFMAATVTSYNYITGVLIVSITSATGIGSFSAWTINLANAVPATGNILVENINYVEDRDIKLFNGFGGIQDIEGIQDVANIQTLKEDGKYVEAFTYQLLLSEYDRLRENFNKDYAVKSKVVPYINKWVQEGTDARDNYYRLNNSMAFGINNLSPNDQVDFTETSVLTQEFPYIDSFPKSYPDENAEFSRSYMFTQLDDTAYQNRTWYDLITSDSRNDWFTKYFSVGYPTEVLFDGTIIPKSREERFTFFNYNNGLDRSQTLFRGVKLQGIIYDDTDPLNIKEIVGSKLLEDYKFAAIMRVARADPRNKEKPVDIEVIRNDIFKSIVMIITLKAEDYRLQHGHADFASQYFMNDILKTDNQYQYDTNAITLTSSNFYNEKPYKPWNTASYEDVSTLRLRQGFLGGGLLQLGNKRLGGIADLTNINYLAPVLTVPMLSVNPTYIFNLQNELSTIINNYSKGPLDIYKNSTAGTLNPLPFAKMYGNNGYVFALHTVYITPALGVGGYPYLDNQTTGDKILPGTLEMGTANKVTGFFATLPNILGTYPPYQSGMEGNPIAPAAAGNGQPRQTLSTALEGGTLGYESIKNYLTVGNIKSLINSKSPAIEYYKIINNTKIPATDFAFELVTPDTIIKTDVLHFANDEDKPQEYTNVDVVGYNLVNTNMQEYLLRHRGFYEPKSRDVLTFWLRESNDFTRHFEKDFLLGNTHINAKSILSGQVQNYGINKVATSGEILNIARGSAYKSLYPLVGEVAVDNWTRFSLDSSWDNNFYRNYQTIIASTEIEGIVEMQETKVFLASKAMNIPNGFEFHTFKSFEASWDLIQPATGIGVNNLVTNTTVNDQYTQGADKPKLLIDIDVKGRLLRQILEDIDSGVYVDEFKKLQSYTNIPKLGSTLTDATINSLKDAYIRKNVLTLYEVTDIYLYVSYNNGIDLVNLFYSEADKNVNGYKIDKDCVVKKTGELSYQITKILDPKVSAGFSISANVKRI
jgi:hypothetical protein